MMLLRRLRGVLITALLWAVVWGFLGGLLLLVVSLSTHVHAVGLSVAQAILAVLAFFGLWGALSGGVFAIAMSVAERQRRIEDLSMRRVALWGALGGATLPAIGTVAIVITPIEGGLPPQIAVLLAITSLLGSLCSAGTLALARRGEVSSV